MQFKVGDKVIYIGENSKTLWIKRGSVYEINKISKYGSLNLKLDSKDKTEHNSYNPASFIPATSLNQELV